MYIEVTPYFLYVLHTSGSMISFLTLEQLIQTSKIAICAIAELMLVVVTFVSLETFFLFISTHTIFWLGEGGDYPFSVTCDLILICLMVIDSIRLYMTVFLVLCPFPAILLYF